MIEFFKLERGSPKYFLIEISLVMVSKSISTGPHTRKNTRGIFYFISKSPPLARSCSESMESEQSKEDKVSQEGKRDSLFILWH